MFQSMKMESHVRTWVCVRGIGLPTIKRSERKGMTYPLIRHRFLIHRPRAEFSNTVVEKEDVVVDMKSLTGSPPVVGFALFVIIVEMKFRFGK